MTLRPEYALSVKLSHALQILVDAHRQVESRPWHEEPATPLPLDVEATPILDLPVPLSQTPTHRTGDLTAI